MTGMLASVKSLDEAMLAAEQGVDFIDLKNPAEGALGALPLPLVHDIVAVLGGRSTLSATIGDLPMQPDLLYRRVKAVAETGVDIVKIGMFGQNNHRACIEMLAEEAEKHHLIAVLMADQGIDCSLLPLLSMAGFYGVMLDTADKRNGRLTEWVTYQQLEVFIRVAQAEDLVCGLAGSLSLDDVPRLRDLGADYLGFRGALCANHERSGRLDPEIIKELRQMLCKCNTSEVCMH